MDHHCVWVGKCVGKNNMTAFKVFIFSVILTLAVFSVSIFLFSKPIIARPYWNQPQLNERNTSNKWFNYKIFDTLTIIDILMRKLFIFCLFRVSIAFLIKNNYLKVSTKCKILKIKWKANYRIWTVCIIDPTYYFLIPVSTSKISD